MKKGLNLLVLTFFLAVSSLQAQIEFCVATVDSDNSTKVTVSAKNTSGAPATIVGVNFAFYYDAAETAVATVDYGPAMAAGWNTAGNTSESDIAQMNASIPTTHDMRYEINMFDGNFVGTTLAPGASLDLVCITFDNTPGTANTPGCTGCDDAGGDAYFANDTEDGGSTVYVDENFTGIPVNFQANIAPLLPVELLSLNATPKGNAIALNWESASEIDFSGYELERGLDGNNFEKIAWVQSEGNSLSANQYTYLDLNVKNSIVYYYRLKMVDLDGSFDYSPIRTAQLGGKGLDVTLYPNPTSTFINMDIVSASDEDTHVVIYDVTGKIVYSNVQEFAEGNSTLRINVADLMAGMYHVVISNSVLKYTENFIIAD